MSSPNDAALVEEQIDQWRSYLCRRRAIQSLDVAELEDHLREHLAALVSVGLGPDEAFLVAVKRIGSLDALSREFAREHSERLWKQLVVVHSDSGEPHGLGRTGALVAFDVLLALVLGLLLYSVSARDPGSPPGGFDVLQVVLVVSALVANGVALWAIAARIKEFGFTPNRVAALGENMILLVNLAWSTLLYVRFLRGMGSFASLEKWQTDYLPVYSGWAAIVVILFPPVFGFI